MLNMILAKYSTLPLMLNSRVASLLFIDGNVL